MFSSVKRKVLLHCANKCHKTFPCRFERSHCVSWLCCYVSCECRICCRTFWRVNGVLSEVLGSVLAVVLFSCSNRVWFPFWKHMVQISARVALHVSCDVWVFLLSCVCRRLEVAQSLNGRFVCRGSVNLFQRSDRRCEFAVLVGNCQLRCRDWGFPAVTTDRRPG
jgi:hypothetical protein